MKLISAFCLCLFGFALSAQEYVHQIIFLNEGWYDFATDSLIVPPSVGSYDPQTETYTVFDEIENADFASDMIVDDVIYVAADNKIITYDKNTLQRLQVKASPGVRELAVWEDQLLVSRGDYLVDFDSYFQVYDKYTLELIYELNKTDGPAYATDGIVIRDDKAYVAINNGFHFGEEVGLIGVVDLNTHSYADEIDLGPAGINPDNIMLDGDHIYTLNNKNFLSSSISIVEPATQTVTTYDMIAANSGCGTSALAADRIYYMEYGVDKLARFDVSTLQVMDTLVETGAYYGLIDDPVNHRLIATLTDFFSSGTAYILSYEGEILSSFDVGISPGNIALDVRMSTGTTDVANAAEVVFAPVPASREVTFSSAAEIREIRLYNAQGQLVLQQDVSGTSGSLAVENLPSGVYIAKAHLVAGEVLTTSLVKE